MSFDGAGAGALAEIGMAELLRGFEDILLDRLRKGVGSDQFEPLFPAYPNDGASDASPSSVCPDPFSGARRFALEDCRVTCGG